MSRDQVRDYDCKWFVSRALQLGLTAPELLLHRLPELLVGHVQIPLSRLEVCMTQQKLNRPQIQAAGQPATSRLVPQIVPVQIDQSCAASTSGGL